MLGSTYFNPPISFYNLMRELDDIHNHMRYKEFMVELSNKNKYSKSMSNYHNMNNFIKNHTKKYDKRNKIKSIHTNLKRHK